MSNIIFVEKIFKTANLTNPYQYFATGTILLLIASHFAFKYIENPMRVKIRNSLNTNKRS